MRVILKWNAFMSIICSILLLSGCFNQPTPVQKIYAVLERVVIEEKGFEEQQDPLIELERKEKEQYDQIMALGMKQYEKVVKIADDAIQNSEQRKAHMDLEMDSLKSSEIEFKKTEKLIKEIDDDSLRKKAENLSRTMIKRYRTHDVLYREYMDGISNDQELYGLFKKRHITLEELESQINKINSLYKEIFTANNQFNELTSKYNKEKLSFYKNAGLKTEKNINN